MRLSDALIRRATATGAVLEAVARGVEDSKEVVRNSGI